MSTTGSHLLVRYLGVAAVFALARVPAHALADAEFTEYVGLGMFSAQGVDLHAPEVVSLNVRAEDWADRGGGTGHAWTSAVWPVEAGLRLNMYGGSNLSGMGGTALTRTRYEFSVLRLDDAAPAYVDLSLTAQIDVTVANSQPDNSRTWFSYGTIWVGARSFSVKNYDANGIYNGVFGRRWEGEPLGSFAVGSPYIIEIDTYSHGEGAGVSFLFDSTVFVDPMIEVVGPDAARYRIEYSPQIAVPEPALWWLLAAGLPLLARARAQRRASPRSTPTPTLTPHARICAAAAAA